MLLPLNMVQHVQCPSTQCSGSPARNPGGGGAPLLAATGGHRVRRHAGRAGGPLRGAPRRRRGCDARMRPGRPGAGCGAEGGRLGRQPPPGRPATHAPTDTHERTCPPRSPCVLPPCSTPAPSGTWGMTHPRAGGNVTPLPRTALRDPLLPLLLLLLFPLCLLLLLPRGGARRWRPGPGAVPPAHHQPGPRHHTPPLQGAARTPPSARPPRLHSPCPAGAGPAGA